MDGFAEIYNAAWAENWGFVPDTRRRISTPTRSDLQLVYIDENGSWSPKRTARRSAIAITPLDINQVLKKMGGRIFPTGWWHFLNKGRICTRVRIGFLGVKPEYQHTGVAAALYIAPLRSC